MKHKKHRKPTSNAFVPIFLVVVGLVLGAFALIIRETHALKTLGRLPMPQVSSLDLPYPLTLSQVETSVLGAETIDAEDFIAAINKAREQYGSPALTINRLLMKAAKLRADVILRYQNFSHLDPYEGIQLDTVLPKLGFHYRYASENIGMGGTSTTSFVKGFMDSPGHKTNLLNPTLSETGAAIVAGSYGQYYVNIAVQIFAIPGGKNDFLGYSPEEREIYRQTINELTVQLARASFLSILPIRHAETYKTWKLVLARQKNIAMEIYTIMKAERPLTNSHIALIREYNENWEKL